MDLVDHVVVLMLENRSFDQVLGNLYEVQDNGIVLDGITKSEVQLNHVYTNATEGGNMEQFPFFGWDEMHQNDTLGLDNSGNPKSPMYPLNKFQSRDVNFPLLGPGEHIDHVFKQLYNSNNQTKTHWDKEVNLRERVEGTISDYQAICDKLKPNEPPDHWPKGEDIIAGFSPETLPVINTLASEFGVCDYWFASVPSQTWPNRCFLHSGTSCGVLKNESGGEVLEAITKFLSTKHPSVFTQLNGSVEVVTGHSKWYQSSMVSILHPRDKLTSKLRWRSMDDFSKNCLDNTLPSYTFIEPRYWTNSDGVQNDQHCMGGKFGHLFNYENEQSIFNSLTVHNAEQLILTIYELMFLNLPQDVVSKRLLIILYDEHGGTFDHVSPPACVPQRRLDNSNKFGFNRLGSRVPAVFISPLIPPHSILRPADLTVGLEHCSLIHSLSERFGMKHGNDKPPMTPRAQNAPTFWNLISSDYKSDPNRLQRVGDCARGRLFDSIRAVGVKAPESNKIDIPISELGSRILLANLLLNRIQIREDGITTHLLTEEQRSTILDKLYQRTSKSTANEVLVHFETLTVREIESLFAELAIDAPAHNVSHHNVKVSWSKNPVKQLRCHPN